ncbi:MAG: hypothetical protein KF819_16395 [Labilithrix sp.]|nr:hypothetical protein [Labilithrix sp.]
MRSATAFVLGCAPASLAEEARERLTQRLGAESDAQAIASCLLALSRLDAAPVREAIASFASAPSRLVRGAWGVAQLRMGGSISDERVAAAVVDWLGAFGDVSPNGFWWWAPTIRFSALNTFFERRLHHGIGLGEMAKSGYGAVDSKSWTDLMLSVPSKTEEGWALRGASDFLAYVHGTLEITPREIMTPAELTADQRALASRLEASPLCPEAGHGLPACGAVRARWLGNAAPSVMEQLLVATESDAHGRSGKVPLYWAESRRILGKPAIPELDALEGFEKWRVLVSDAFGEYSPNWLPPSLEEVDGCVEQACADSRMAETLASLADECAARVREFRRQRLTPKYWAISALLLVRPLTKHGVAWKDEWESLISMAGDPEAWVREMIAWVPADVRERWLWENLQRLRFEVHYVDLLPSARLVERSLLSIHDARNAGRKLLATTLDLERAIHELAKTNPVFTQAVREVNAEARTTS